MSKSIKVLIIAFFIVAVLLWWWLPHRNRAAYERAWFKLVPPDHAEDFAKIQQSWHRNDFDAATWIALGSVRGIPSDDILYSTASSIYFSRTQLDPTRSQQRNDEWVKLAVQYSERALAANPSDLVNAYNLAQAYQTAGMNSQPPNSCAYYKQSEAAYEELSRNEILKKHSGIIEGEQVDFDPYRKKLADQLDSLRDMMTVSKCK